MIAQAFSTILNIVARPDKYYSDGCNFPLYFFSCKQQKGTIEIYCIAIYTGDAATKLKCITAARFPNNIYVTPVYNRD